MKRRGKPATQFKLIMAATKELFGATYGWNTKAQAEMRRQTEPPWVGNSLAITQKHLGRVPKFSVSLQERRDFPEGEQTGNVRKFDGRHHVRGLDEG
jgi:hypothetical protein